MRKLYAGNKANVFAKTPNKQLGTDKSRLTDRILTEPLEEVKPDQTDYASTTGFSDNTAGDLQKPDLKDDILDKI